MEKGTRERVSERLASELDCHARTCGDVGSCHRGLLARYSAAYDFEFEAGILRGFYGAAERLAHEGGDFDASLLDVEDYRTAGGKLGLSGGLAFELSRLCYRRFRFSHCRLDYRLGGIGSRGRGLPHHTGFRRFVYF